MASLLRNVAALIVAVTILQFANGLLGVRLPLAFEQQGHSTTQLGIVAALYSAGFMMGATLATTLLSRVGHIRVYAACAALFAAATLALHFSHDVWAWGLWRLAAGVVVALLFAVIESWLNFSIGPGARGEVMSVYMVATKAALALGPFLVIGVPYDAPEPWMIAAAIIAVSIAPVCFTSTVQPDPPKAQPLALVEQFAIAPAAVIASFGAGLVNAGVLAIAPLYANQNFGAGAAAEFYAAAWIGSLILQWPAGRLSDRVDRRAVIGGLTLLAGVSGVALAMLGGAPRTLVAFVFMIWGAGALSFYGIAVAHMADRAEPGKLAQSAAGLLFVWAAGSVIGPLAMGALVDWFGVAGMFWFAGAASLAITAAMFWRRTAREGPAVKEEFAPQVDGTSVASGEIAYGDDPPAAEEAERAGA